MRLKPFFGVLTAAVLACASPAIAKTPPGMLVRSDLYLTSEYDAARDPDADLKAAMAEAARTHRVVLLDVGGEWCSWCHEMDDFLARHKEIGDAFAQAFVIAKINWQPDDHNEKFLSAYPKIDGYPHFFVLDPAGELLLDESTSLLEQGKSYNPTKMLAFAKDWQKR